MAKAKLKTAVAQPNNGSIVIYYSHQDTMRFPTGVTITKEKTKDGNFKEWDYKAASIKPYLDNFDVKDEEIKAWLNRANTFLKEHYQDGHTLTGKELQQLLVNYDKKAEVIRSADLLTMYEQFWMKKQEYFVARNKAISLKDYTSFKNMLYDYQTTLARIIKIREVNDFFLEHLANWMRQPRPKFLGDYKMKTKGRLNDKTMKKRLDIFIQFGQYLKKLDIMSNVDFIGEFAAKEINVVREDKVTLTIDEVHKLYQFEFGNQRLNNIRDLFVFACFTGMRWGDLVDFDWKFVQPSTDGQNFIYKRKANKTKTSSGVSYKIPLSQIPLEILRRNGNSLNPILVSNVKANKYIKEALGITGLFNGYTEILDSDTKQHLRRFEAITMHKGRDTFISNLVSTTPLNELMLYTGHTKLSTLQVYIDMTREVSPDFVKIFNR